VTTAIQSDHAFACVRARARAVATGDRDQSRGERLLDDVPREELVRLRGIGREDDCGVERPFARGHTVRDEVDDVAAAVKEIACVL